MSVETGTATSSADLLNKLNTFLKKGHALSPQYTTVGDGKITGLIGTADSVFETITVTFTSATEFDVNGSVTGAMGSGEVDVLFEHANVEFTIEDGDVAFEIGDEIAFVMTPPWEAMREVADSEYIWKAPGDDDAQEIYVGALRFNDTGAGNYDNWRLGGMTGYIGASSFVAQPGMSTLGATGGPILPLWNSTIPYWFIATGARVIILAKVSNSYESAYLGFIHPYMSPGSFPYPLVVGGAMSFTSEPGATSSTWRFSNVNTNQHRAFFHPHTESTTTKNSGQLRMRKPDGSWTGFQSGYSSAANAPGAVWPYAADQGGGNGGTQMDDLRPNLDGSYPLFPIVLSDNVTNAANMWGELVGVRAITHFGNAVENTIEIGRETWIVWTMQTMNTARAFAAVRLD